MKIRARRCIAMAVLGPLVAGIVLAIAGARVSGSSSLTRYVDDDDPTCGSNSPCYASIQPALDAADPGDLILVGPGTYVGSLKFEGKSIALRSTNGPEVTVIDGDGGTAVDIGPGGEIAGFTIRNGYASFGAGMRVRGSGTLIKGNIFDANHQGGGGFGAGVGGNGSSPTIEQNLFRNNTCDNQHLSGVVSFVNNSSPRIVNNVFADNPCRAINMTLPTGTSPEVINNTMVRNRAGAHVDRRVSATLQVYRNNIIADNETGLEVVFGSEAKNPTWQHNLVFDNGLDYDGIADQTGLSGNISADPMFVDIAGGDFRLRPGSPAIDAGSNVSAPDTDFEGNPRPVDGDGDGTFTSDIGADEFCTGDECIVPTPTPTLMSTSTFTPTPTSAFTPTPVPTSTPMPTPTATPTPTPTEWNEMAVDADGSTEPVDGSATYSVGATFEASVNITRVDIPYAGYQAKAQFDPGVLAYADPPGVTYQGLGGMVLDARPYVGADYVWAGSGRISGTTTDTGQAQRIGFECIAEGTSPLHLVTLLEDLPFGTKTMELGGITIETALIDASVTCEGDMVVDSDGDGCKDGEEAGIGFDPLAWYDFYDVPVPVNPDSTPNGPRNHAVSMQDVSAVMFYLGTYEGDAGSPNANGVAYDSVKGSCDVDGDTVADKEGLCYDRSPGAEPNPPWDAGPPDGAVSMDDMLMVLAQVGLDCNGEP